MKRHTKEAQEIRDIAAHVVRTHDLDDEETLLVVIELIREKLTRYYANRIIELVNEEIRQIQIDKELRLK